MSEFRPPNSYEGQYLDHWHYNRDYTRIDAYYGFGCDQVCVQYDAQSGEVK